MARPAEGWVFRPLKKPGGCWSIRFTDASGRQVDRGTGERDKAAAARRAVEIYAAESGQARWVGEPSASAAAAVAAAVDKPLGPIAEEWLAAAAGGALAVETAATYAQHVVTHLAPFFDKLGGLDAVTLESTRLYIAARLRCVKAPTVRRELTTLRGILSHAGVREEEMPLRVATVGKKAKGTAHSNGKRTATPLSPAQARQLLQLLPARDRRGRVLRLRYAWAYETSLRPRTVAQLEVPQHWRRGQQWVTVSDALDKIGFGRRVPLSRRAYLYLMLVTNGGRREGLVFGKGTNRKVLKAAARAVLGAGRTFQPYDLRRNRLTHWIEEGAPLNGVQWQAGHSRVSTTAIYVLANERAGAAVVSGTRVPKIPVPAGR